MNKYELTIVLDGKATAAKKKSVTEKMEKMVKALKGTVLKVKDWGVKDLYYEIKKSTTGTFLIFELELEGQAAKSINDKMKFEEEVIRYLLIKKGVR